MSWKRIHPLPEDSRNSGIMPQYAADEAAWIWHPDAAAPEKFSVVEFTLEFELSNAQTFTFQLSADNRFELYLDGEYCCMGPDRCDLTHWSFAAYSVTIGAGKHTFAARCIYFPDPGYRGMPLAQIMLKPGFLFAAAEKEFREMFNTGKGKWQARLLRGVSSALCGWATGCEFIFDLARWFEEEKKVAPVVTGEPKSVRCYGGLQDSRRLCPSPLEEQMHTPFSGKCTVRAVTGNFASDRAAFAEADCRAPEIPRWQKFFDNAASVTVPPRTRLCILADFEDYLCAFPELEWEGGRGSTFRLLWTEALYGKEETAGYYRKGNRSQVAGKEALEFQKLTLTNPDGTRHRLSPFWWLAGRYVLLTVETQDEALTLHKITFFESRYPLENVSSIALNEELDALKPMMFRAMQCCSHESYMDCPFYEQLMYIGDSRLEALANFTMARESALPLRVMELFNSSRADWNGFAGEHYPSRGPQLSGTFSMILVLMVRDYMMYRAFPSVQEFRKLRNGMRNLVNSLAEYVNEEGLISGLPGWSFVDWIDSWLAGTPVPPGTDLTDGHGAAAKANASDFAILTLLFMNTLLAMAELERFRPDEFSSGMEQSCRKLHQRCKEAVQKHFFIPEKGLFSDFRGKASFSMHAQSLAILGKALEEKECAALCRRMIQEPGIIVPTISFIHYLFDAFATCGCGEKIMDYTYIWSAMKDQGAVSCWERPDPARSDCHAWGAHLYSHYFATLAGIRPASPEFRTVEIRPALGTLPEISGRLVHPEGFIEFSLRKEKDKLRGRITLPPGITGNFAYGEQHLSLKEGTNLL